MALNVGEIVAKIRADAKEFNKGLDEAKKRTTKFKNNLVSSSNDIASGMKANLLPLVASGGVITALGLKAVKAAGEMEQLEVAFTTMLGDADKAKGLLGEIADFAANTPFELTEVQKGSKALLAFGIEAENIIPSMKNLGDIAAGVGMPIDELATIYGKARTSGTLFAEDINQLTERGIPIIGELAEQFGVAESEVKGLVSEGKVGFEDLQTAFANMSGEGGQFNNLMAAQSETLLGQWSNLQDSLHQFAVSIGEQLLPAAVSFVDFMNTTLIPAVKSVVEWMMQNKDIVLAVAIGIASLLVPAFVSWAIASAAAAISTIAAMAPLLLLGAAVAAVALIVIRNWDWIMEKTEGLRNFFKSIFQWIYNFLVGNSIIPDIVNAIKNWWNKLISFFQKTKEKLMDAITYPFKKAREVIEDVMSKAREALDKINPFHRESPSLVDNVQNGVRQIMSAYEDLSNIDNMVPAVANVDVTGSGQGVTQNNNFGDVIVRNDSDIDSLGQEFAFRTRINPGYSLS